MKTVQEKIAVMQAFADGKPIEFSKGDGDWVVVGRPTWNWHNCDYRIQEDQELKAYNLYLGHAAPCITDDARKWMRKIINAVKAGEIT